MCLQWCHVRSLIVHNDYACVHCPSAIRLAEQEEDCSTCIHSSGAICNLTKYTLPSARTCCHHNAAVTQAEYLELTEENILPMQLIYYQADSLKALFWLVESAPDPLELPDGTLQVRMADLAIPVVYGVPANEWGLA